MESGHGGARQAAAAGDDDTGATRGLVLLCAASVAGVYYLQPLLVVVAVDLGIDGVHIGLVPMVGQFAVGLGIAFLLPLGDVFDSRRIVIGAVVGQILAMLAMAAAPGPWTFTAGCALLGVTTIAPYLIPAAVSRTTEPRLRGRVTGALLRGVIVGILFARSVGGVVAAHVSWRVVYALAGAAAALVLWRYAAALPKAQPAATVSYRQLMASLPDLVRREPELRLATLTQALMFGTFGSLWIGIGLLIQSPAYGMSSAVVGALGLLGLVSATAAPRAGGLIDRYGADRVTRFAIALTIVAWAAMAAFGRTLPALGLGIVMLDLGASAAHIAKQTVLFGLPSAHRTRCVTVYIVGQYVGGGVLALLTGYAWSRGGWLGVCVLGLATTFAALLVNRPRRAG